MEFWTQFADDDPDGAQQWIQHQTTLEQMRSRSHELEQALELERQAQAAAQAHHDTVAKGIEAAKARHKDWDALTPIMQALADAGAMNAALDVETAEQAEQLGDGIYRSAREVRRAKEEADFLTAFRATGPPPMAEGFHSAQNEPDWDRVPVVEPKLRERNVLPVPPPQKRVEAFRAALLDDPIRAELQRTISKSPAVKKLGKGKR